MSCWKVSQSCGRAAASAVMPLSCLATLLAGSSSRWSCWQTFCFSRDHEDKAFFFFKDYNNKQLQNRQRGWPIVIWYNILQTQFLHQTVDLFLNYLSHDSLPTFLPRLLLQLVHKTNGIFLPTICPSNKKTFFPVCKFLYNRPLCLHFCKLPGNQSFSHFPKYQIHSTIIITFWKICCDLFSFCRFLY